MSNDGAKLRQVLKAIATQNLPQLRKLLGSGGIDLDQTYQGQLALVDAVPAGVDFVTALLVGGANVNARDDRGYTALIKAAEQGNVPVLQTLLAGGADPELMKDNVTSPLIAAARVRSRRHLEALNCLIAHGVNVNALSRSL